MRLKPIEITYLQQQRNLVQKRTDVKLTGVLNPLNAELNPIRHLLALVEARHIVHVSRIRVNV
jgi:hypothetical protein